MKLAIMQPYFFPYLGYFSLIEATDYWIFFDNVQFIRHGWIERNRVLNSNQDISYIKVPLIKFNRHEKIKNVTINHSLNWEDKIFAQLTSYKKAPFYNEILDLIKSTLDFKHEYISTLNIYIIRAICKYLGLEFKFSVYSEMNLELEDKIFSPGDWAFEISKHMSAKSYINLSRGVELFNSNKFNLDNIELLFCENNLSPYKQRHYQFTEGLSIIDVLMFNSPEETINLIKDYKITDGKKRLHT